MSTNNPYSSLDPEHKEVPKVPKQEEPVKHQEHPKKEEAPKEKEHVPVHSKFCFV